MPVETRLQGALRVGEPMSERECCRVSHLLKLDKSQKAAVLSDRNCVVTAGAGAGKTSVLAARYIDLVVNRGIPVRGILALTFTRKAATEMYERIYRELEKIDSSRAREQLADFENARITTIDAFCAEIARHSARNYGYTPDFAIDADKSDEMASRMARDFVIANRKKPGLHRLLSSFPFEDVAEDLFAGLARSKMTPLALSGGIFSPMKEGIGQYARAEWRRTVDEMAGLCRETVSCAEDVAVPHAGCAAAIDASKAFLEAIGSGGWEDIPGVGAKNAPEWSAGGAGGSRFDMARDNIGKLTLRSFSTKDPGELAIKELTGRNRKNAAMLKGLTSFLRLLPEYGDLLELLDAFALSLAEAKRLAGIMDYKDVAACAIDTLASAKNIRAAWKSAIRSIMIDEFQDNNSAQKDLLYLLAEKEGSEADGIPDASRLDGNKLFFVGDEKQSIYLFRGADVSVFKRLSGELTAGPGGESAEALELGANYRSTRALVEFFNDFFSHVMKPADPDAGEADFEARFAGMKAGKPPEAYGNIESHIELFLVGEDGDDSGEPNDRDGNGDNGDNGEDDEIDDLDEMLALEVAGFIRDNVGNLRVRDAGAADGTPGSKPADYGDFAVLLRKTGQQALLEKYFRLFSIPFESESPRALFRESPALDIYFILSLLLDPSDRKAYAAVLRSPLCRVSDGGFLELMLSDGDIFEAAPGMRLSGHDLCALGRAKRFYDSLRAVAGERQVARLVDYVWNYAGLRLDILSRPQSHSFLEHFDFLFHIAAGIDAAGGGPVDFIRHVRPYIDDTENRYEIEDVPRPAGRGVRILTIHKSKGLQFPVVILPWMESATPNRRRQSKWHELPEGIAIDVKPYDDPEAKSSNVFFDIAKESEKRKEEAEAKRLLYVACTRAEDHLFFFGKKRTRAAGGPNFLEMARAYNEEGGGPAIKVARLPRRTLADFGGIPRKEAAPEPCLFAEAYARAGLAETARPAWRISVTAISARRAAEAATPAGAIHVANAAPGIIPEASAAAKTAAQAVPAPSEPPDGFPPAAFGTLCHDLIAHAISSGSLEGYVPPAAVLREIPESARENALGEAAACAGKFLESGFWRSVPPGARVETEKLFFLKAGRWVVEGRMDLFIETKDRILVIDFKTDRVEEAVNHATQMAIYRAAAEGFGRAPHVETGLFWLRSGRLQRLDGRLTAEEIAVLAAEASEWIEEDGPDMQECADE